jgi:hypothetical protein
MTRPILTEATLPTPEATLPETGRNLFEGAQRAGAAFGSALKAQVRAHPYQAILVAGGVGYALAGGLLAPAASRLLRGGARFLIMPMLAAVAESVAEVASQLLAEREQRRP